MALNLVQQHYSKSTLIHPCKHTGTRTHKYTIHSLQHWFKPLVKRGLRWRKIAAQGGKHGRSNVLEKNILRLDLKGVQKGLLSDRKGKVISSSGTKDRKG